MCNASNGVLLSNEKECTVDKHNINKYQIIGVKKEDKKKYITCVSIYLKF